MKKLILSSALTLTALFTYAQGCTDLFISEYVVGSNNNRALEIYNPTPNPINLANYKVGRFRDGASNPMLLSLSNTLQPYETWVVTVDKRDENQPCPGLECAVDSVLQALTDTFVNPVYSQSNSPFYFNGDDAVILSDAAGTLIIDLVGKIGEDPGTAWSDTSGGWWTTKHTLVRKSNVLDGVKVNPSEFLVMTEWDSLPENTFDQLGFHTCDCSTNSIGENDAREKLSVYPNPASEKFFVKAPSAIEEIRIYNITGQQVYADKKSLFTNFIEVQPVTYSAGLYVVSVKLKSGKTLVSKLTLK
ncbi:MAG: lamin tail domain-containing protein [Bacteroidia bacterium]